MPFPSLNSTWARHRTRGRLHTFLWIQEISQTWCVAKFQFECDYRVSSGPFYQPVNSRTESHQNKPNTGEKSHFCSWFSEKDSKRRHLKAQTFLPSHDLAEPKRKMFSAGFITCFSFDKDSVPRISSSKQSLKDFQQGKAHTFFFLKSNNSIMKWTSWKTFHSYEEMRSVTNDSASIIIYKACLEGKKILPTTKGKRTL